MAGKPKKKKDRKRIEQVLLQALACGATVESAAHKAGIGVRTLYRRFKNPEFRAKVQQFQTDMVNRASGMLTGASLPAVKVMVDLLQDPTVAPSVRRQIAKDLLEMAPRYRECAEIEGRVRDIERRLANGTSDKQESA
jgi:hypothetical protein